MERETDDTLKKCLLNTYKLSIMLYISRLNINERLYVNMQWYT